MLDGVLIVDKPRGMTSFDVVAQLRRAVGQKKIGHAGTLDPNVEGVLVIALGKATKLIDLLQTRPKTYQGEITLGFRTETEDSDGAIIEEQALKEALPAAVIDQALHQLKGNIIQIPPMYSAVKVNGRRLYEYARAGEEVKRPQRSVTVYEFQRTSPLIYQEQRERFDFEARVSKGTYIRTLASDVGVQLGLPATMTRLIRTEGSGFTLAQSTPLADLLAMSSVDLQQKVQPIASLLDWPREDLSDAEWFAVSNGQKMKQWPSNDSGYLQLYYRDELKAVYNYDEADQLWRSRYVFNNQ